MINSSGINPIRILAGLFVIAVLVLGTAQKGFPAENEIDATLKKPFRIVLSAATGSTGYSWFPNFDKSLLKLKKSWNEKPETKLIGASGKQVFVFIPLKPGKTKIEMTLKRPWESSIAEAKVYLVSVAPK
ncbi:MAG: protease inhibitor I42 family protein [Deltaproteobacteria bacterium]|nr:protease inhibitor I42 family protein [Deltaproteobacteria bacterium]